MKKILLFGFTDKKGGIESFLLDFIKHVDRNSFSFDCIVNTSVVAYEKELLELGVGVYHLPMRSKAPLKFKKECHNFFKKKATEYDAIWVNVCSLANIDYLKYAKKYGIPKRIIHCHNSQNMDSKARGILHRFNRLFIRYYATDFWTCSDKASEWFYNMAIRNSSKYYVFENSVDLDKYRFNPELRHMIREKLNISKDTLILGNVGRLHPQKNQSFLIDVFNRFHCEHVDSKLWIIGQGELRSSLEKKVNNLGLDDSVYFFGEVSNINEIYQGMDFFVFPSLYEGMSIALLEAQANGLTCIISLGNPENSVLNDNVFRIETFDEDIWVDRIQKSSIKRADTNKLRGSEHDINIQIQKFEEIFR